MTTPATPTIQTYSFGTGYVIANVAGKSPMQIGVLQDIEVDFESTIKELMGQDQIAVAVGRGPMKISGKAKTGVMDGQLMANLFFNQSISTGFPDLAIGEAHSVPASGPYTVTSTNSATWTADMGVFYASNNAQLVQVASSPALGQYTVAAGVYTFAAADEGVAMLFNYQWSNTTGHNFVVQNQLMGVQPVFTMFLKEGFTNFGGQTYATLNLNRCICTKLTLPFKNSDFAISDLDFSCFADPSQNVATFGFSV